MGRGRQNIQMYLAFAERDRSEASVSCGRGTETSVAVCGSETPTEGGSLIKEVCERENLREALKRVRSNRGSLGVDGDEGRGVGGGI